MQTKLVTDYGRMIYIYIYIFIHKYLKVYYDLFPDI